MFRELLRSTDARLYEAPRSPLLFVDSRFRGNDPVDVSTVIPAKAGIY